MEFFLVRKILHQPNILISCALCSEVFINKFKHGLPEFMTFSVRIYNVENLAWNRKSGKVWNYLIWEQDIYLPGLYQPYLLGRLDMNILAEMPVKNRVPNVASIQWKTVAIFFKIGQT
jgi:hypothetical protein